MADDAPILGDYLQTVRGLAESLECGIRVADFGCGAGRLVNMSARRYPNSSFVGYDLDEQGIATATTEASAWGVRNARFRVLDVTDLPERPTFDLITSFGSLLEQRDPTTTLRRVAQALAPDGICLILGPDVVRRTLDEVGFTSIEVVHGPGPHDCLYICRP